MDGAGRPGHERHAVADARDQGRHGARCLPDAAGIGNEFEVVVRDRPYRAEQVKLPFYRRASATERGVRTPQGGSIRPWPIPTTSPTRRSTSGSAWTGSRATIGITSFAADELGDIVFVELPEVGASAQPVRHLRRRREREGGQRPVRARLRRGGRGQRGAARRAGAAELRSVRRGLDREGRARRPRRARRASWTPPPTPPRPPEGGTGA